MTLGEGAEDPELQLSLNTGLSQGGTRTLKAGYSSEHFLPTTDSCQGKKASTDMWM